MKEYDAETNKMVGYSYLCNWAVGANWLKTDIANKRVNCKNCLRAIKKYKKECPDKDISFIRNL